MKKIVFLVYLSAWSGLAFAQAPTVDKSTVAFTYQYNNANNILTAKVTAKLTTTTTLMSVDYSSLPAGWLSVTPVSGSSPLALTVTANPTSLSPGSYTGSLSIYTGSSCASSTNCTTVPVTLMITNPASSLLLLPAASGPPLTATTSASAYTLALPYTSGTTAPNAEVDVSTTGDIIPFTVTTAVTKAGTGTVANWLRVNTTGPLATGSTSTSGVASGSSIVPIYVTLDQSTLDTLDAINYTGTITIAPVKTGTSSSSSTSGTTFTVTVTLSVAPGAPVLSTIFPLQVPVILASAAVATVPPILTVYGDNFFYNGSWVFYRRPDLSYHPLPTTWVSRKLLTATIPVADLTAPQVNGSGETWNIVVVNGAPNTLPSNLAAQSSPATFTVTDPTVPFIQAVVNAASYLPTATELPAGSPNYPSVVSPREIISIFGLNFGPTSTCSNTPVAFTDPNGFPQTQYSATIPACNYIGVSFQVGTDQSWPAPLIVATANQINAIVPAEMGPYPDGTIISVTVTVMVAGVPKPVSYSVYKISFDPGIFTFGGNGQGQAAVLNVDASTGAVTVNGAASAPKGSPIEIFMTGLGDLAAGYAPPNGLIDGQVACSACSTPSAGPFPLLDDSYRVLIGGQSAPIFYAGTAGTGVAGLVQINAIVPPSTASGAQPITVEIGGPLADTPTQFVRRSQTGVTINVK